MAAEEDKRHIDYNVTVVLEAPHPMAGTLCTLQCRCKSHLDIWVAVHAVDHQVMHIVCGLQHHVDAVGIASHPTMIASLQPACFLTRGRLRKQLPVGYTGSM